MTKCSSETAILPAARAHNTHRSAGKTCKKPTLPTTIQWILLISQIRGQEVNLRCIFACTSLCGSINNQILGCPKSVGVGFGRCRRQVRFEHRSFEIGKIPGVSYLLIYTGSCPQRLANRYRHSPEDRVRRHSQDRSYSHALKTCCQLRASA